MRVFSIACALLAMAGCAATPQPAAEPQLAVEQTVIEKPATMLLVALDDGTTVMQQIETDADLCWKSVNQPETSCFTRGEPIVDPHTSRVIGYRMKQSSLLLYPE